MPRLVLALVLLATGCDFLPDPVPLDVDAGRVQVHAVLGTGADTVRLALTRGVRDADGAGIEPVSGADVRLAAGTATAILTEALPGASSCLGTPFPDPSREPDPAGPGCYVGVVPGGVGAGTEYALHITLVDGTVVTGRTTPPARLRIESPHRDSVYRLQARLGAVEAVLRVRWEGGPHGVLLSAPRARTVFRADSVVAVDETCELHLSRRPVLDVVDDGDPVAVAVARCRAVDADDGFGWDSLRSDIGLTAMDSAYAEYRDVVLGRGSVALERAGPGLDGAVGVFGSVARSRPSYLLLPPP